MISYINGKLVEKNPTHVIIECNGLGYQINVSLHTFGKIEDKENCKLFTEFIVREDAQLLYGFAEKSERELFQLLVSVSGVGASTALMVLSAGSPSEIKEALTAADDTWFVAVKGIGKKTAQRIIIDLKDKVTADEIKGDFSASKGNTVKNEALSALVMLGFNKNQANKRIEKLLQKEPNLQVEEIVKHTLKGG